MRTAILAAAASLCALAGCTTTSNTDSAVTAAQNAAVTACKYLPTAETVADIIKVGDPRLATAKAIAQAICDAINPATPAGTMNLLFKPAPTVDGVVIRGEHVG